MSPYTVTLPKVDKDNEYDEKVDDDDDNDDNDDNDDDLHIEFNQKPSPFCNFQIDYYVCFCAIVFLSEYCQHWW